MKRPLLWAAFLLTLGVILINTGEETRNKWLLRKPSVRMALERSSSGFFPVSLNGRVLWAEEKNGQMIYRLDAGRSLGTVLVYESVQELEDEKDPAMLIGSFCRINGTAFLFPSRENPGQFDVRRYYDDQGIYFGVSQAEIWTDEPSGFSFRRCIYRMSEAMRKTVRENASEQDADFLLYLTFSAYSDESAALKEKAAALSAIQLLSLSGFIISSIGMLLYRLLRKLSRNLTLCALAPAGLMILYFSMLGSPVSMIRALTVFFLRIAAPALKRRFDTVSAAALSVLLLGIMRPAYLLLPGMSFYLAVFLSQGIICPMVRRLFFRQKALPGILLSFFSMQACMLPVQILTRYSWSLYGTVLVWFLLPLRTASVILTFLGALIGNLFNGAANGFLQLYFKIPSALRAVYIWTIEAASGLPFASFNAGNVSAFKVVVYTVLLSATPLLLAVRFRILRQRHVQSEKRLPVRFQYFFPAVYVLILLLGMFSLRTVPPGKEEMIYTMLSVGQGDSGIVRTRDLTIGIDCGSSSGEDAGDIFMGASAFYGVRKIDVLVLSHEDLDHTNGLQEILSDPALTVGEIWIPDSRTAEASFGPLIEMAAKAGVPVRKAGKGDRMTSGDTVLEVLAPVHGADLSGNEQSLVIRITHGERSLVFTGDISAETEERIVFPEEKTDILKIAHHGSRFSSGESLIRRVSPRLAVVSYGKNNTYGHPADEALDRFTVYGIKVYGTGKSGAIEACLREDQIILRFYGTSDDAELPLN